MKAVQLVIQGRVQGVGFRYSAQSRAQALGLTGWVANRPDGTVEALVQGAEEAVDAFITWAQQGPPGARVDRVGVHPAVPNGHSGFHIRS